MRKVINGRKYDTDTAAMVGTWGNGLGWHDFHNVVETLYRKRNGEYFLVGEGGPATQYAKPVGDMWGAGTNFMPMTYQHARQWAEVHMDPDDYEAEFGDAPEGDGTSTICVSIPDALRVRLQRRVREDGQTLADVVKSALESYLA